MVQDVGSQGRIEYTRSCAFTTRNRRSDNGENSRTDNGADAQSGQRPRTEGLFQAVFGILRVQYQLVDGLAAQQLACQWKAPRP
jgi:hypothetical protein